MAREMAAKDFQRDSTKVEPDRADGLYWGVLAVLQSLMAIEVVILLMHGLWPNALLVLLIMSLALAPLLVGHRLAVRIPAEFQVIALVFVFASLFLGETQRYYERIWWWDLALHASSGILFGILGFLLVYALNENEHIEVHMQPRFVAFFACVFAIAVGTVWEIFEFVVDRLFGTTMQKPSLTDPSGLTDTMWDLIVNVIGAFAISLFGWWYLRSKKRSFIELWIQKFVAINRHIFRQSETGKRSRTRSPVHPRASQDQAPFRD